MSGFTIVDAIVAGVIVISAILAYSRGFVREALSIGGWIFAAVVGFIFADAARPLVEQAPVVNKILAGNCDLSTIAGFAVVFAGALVISGLITPLIASLVSQSALSSLDQGLGFLFGVARGVLIVAVAFSVYTQMVAIDSVAAVANSRSVNIFARVGTQVEDQMPDDAPGWIEARYKQLVKACPAPVATPAPAAGTAPAAAPAN